MAILLEICLVQKALPGGCSLYDCILITMMVIGHFLVFWPTPLVSLEENWLRLDFGLCAGTEARGTDGSVVEGRVGFGKSGRFLPLANSSMSAGVGGRSTSCNRLPLGLLALSWILLNRSKRSTHRIELSSRDFNLLGRSYVVVGVGGIGLCNVNIEKSSRKLYVRSWWWL